MISLSRSIEQLLLLLHKCTPRNSSFRRCLKMSQFKKKMPTIYFSFGSILRIDRSHEMLKSNEGIIRTLGENSFAASPTCCFTYLLLHLSDLSDLIKSVDMISWSADIFFQIFFFNFFFNYFFLPNPTDPDTPGRGWKNNSSTIKICFFGWIRPTPDTPGGRWN